MAQMIRLYTFAQLEALWIKAGGDRASAPIMAAIALAESSGNPNASNHNSDGSIDRGLWQINSTHGSLSTFDPLANAQAAVKVKKSQGLGAWVTYTSGAYKKYLKSNVPPDNNGLPTGSTSATNAFDPTDPFGLGNLSNDLGTAIGDGFGAAFQTLLQPLVELALWGAEIMFGIGLMVGGTILFALNTNAGKEATSKATSLAGTALEAAAPETIPELAALSRIRSQAGRKAIVKQKAREAAQNSARGQRVAAKRREERVQAEQKSQAERKYIRQEAARRNRGNGSTGNRKS